MTKHIIWSNRNLDFSDWEEDLREEYPELTDEELIMKMQELNDRYLEDERVNLSVETENRIVIFTDYSLWDGHAVAVRLPEDRGKNIRDCLNWPNRDCEYAEWYVDMNRDLCCRAFHHDGCNSYTYRVLKDGIGKEEYDSYIEQLYEKKRTVRDLFDDITEGLGVKIAAVYGWNLEEEET